MNIRWRLSLLALQLATLIAATWYVTGSPVHTSGWYAAGLLAIIVNPALLEPWYAKPQDALVNATLGTVLWGVSPRVHAEIGWNGLLAFLLVVGLASIVTLVVGAGREEGAGVQIARSARGLTRVGTAVVIYSAIFWLSLIEWRPTLDTSFWILGLVWAVIVFTQSVNWQALWATATGAPIPCKPEGMIGPSILILSAASLPRNGARVRLEGRGCEAEGVLMTRIQRSTDVWAEVFIAVGDCDHLVRQSNVTVTEIGDEEGNVVGAVDAGSSESTLQFITPRTLKVGHVVVVGDGQRDVLHQITHAEIERATVRGGSHLVVRARAAQLGEFDTVTGRINRNYWVPAPGSAVRRLSKHVVSKPNVPDSYMQIGEVLGTNIPVFLDLDQVCEGHLAVLGMTRMGKTSFSVQLASALAGRFSVSILDQTGEYSHKRQVPKFTPDAVDRPGLSVIEPKPGDIAADRALDCLKWLVEKARNEYREGVPPKRVLVLEEAHQFIPEPAGLGFNAPGRDSSYEFGLLMMQIRKYGLSVVMISQRTAVVAKSALSQCENIIAFKSVDHTGLDYLQSIMGSEARHVLPALQCGQAIAFGPAMSLDAPVVIDVIPPGTVSMPAPIPAAVRGSLEDTVAPA